MRRSSRSVVVIRASGGATGACAGRSWAVQASSTSRPSAHPVASSVPSWHASRTRRCTPSAETIVGFENHSGTHGARRRSWHRSPELRSVRNNDRDGTEGVLRHRGWAACAGLRIGTYLHGPFLPREPASRRCTPQGGPRSDGPASRALHTRRHGGMARPRRARRTVQTTPGHGASAFARPPADRTAPGASRVLMPRPRARRPQDRLPKGKQVA